MWYIEHISLRGIIDSPVLRKTSFSDIVHNGDIVTDQTKLHQTYFDTTSLVKRVNLPANLKFNQIYGKAGATPSDLIVSTRTDLLIEVPATWLRRIPKHLFKEIISKHHVLITDFEDGGMFINNELCEYLISLRTMPKKTIYHLTSSTLLNDVPHLNLKHIHVPYWIVNHGTVAYTHYKHNIAEHVDLIANSKYENKLLFLNFKPRLYRMKSLIALANRGVLDESGVDWSLINLAPGVENPVPCRSDIQFSMDNTVTEEIHQQNYAHLTSAETQQYHEFMSRYTLPKYHTPANNIIQSWLPAESDFASYQWNYAVETHYGNEFPLRYNMGTASFMTEKTYKGFTQASMPVILCAGDTNKYLTDQGFLLDNMPFSATVNQVEKFEQVIDFIDRIVQDDIKPDVDKLIHNFKHITDIEHTAKVFTHCLENLSDVIDGQ